MNFRGLIILGFCSLLLISCQESRKPESSKALTDTLVSPLGKILLPVKASEKMLEQYEKARADFQKDPNQVDNTIWYGRRTAYLGKYLQAIDIYSEGIKKFPKEARLYRHRGHRYISIRQFDKAIFDLEKAAELIAGTKNTVEPDGMPNALNIPVSTLHGNIYYHLGLAYYLKHDYEKAYDAYVKCRNSGSNDDNLVSSTHWLFMIQQRLNNPELASEMLTPIHDSLKIIENIDYYRLCRFYKGLIPLDSLKTIEKGSSSDAVNYGLGNWYYSNGKSEKAREIFNEIIEANTWNSFGYIAAESDILTYYNHEQP